MKKLNVTIVRNKKPWIEEETVYNLAELREYITNEAQNWEIVQKREGKRRKGYYNIPMAFDIETTTIPAYKPDGTIDAEKSYGYMYHWQFCINDHVIFGRTWEEFEELHDMLVEVLETGEYLRAVIFVHSLGFEFQFIKDIIGEQNITDLFARTKRKPLYFRERSGLEWRCSYFLSNMSLQKFCENSLLCTHYKLDGEAYDYKKLRTPQTTMTEYELGYCYNDVRGLCECIATLLLEDTMATLPLTSTGFVRRDVRRAMEPQKKNVRKCALTYEQYVLARKCFRGGDTHANRKHTGIIMTDVYSVDESSAYPAVMMIDYFPVSPFYSADDVTRETLYYYTRKYCCMFTIVLADVTLKQGIAMPYIDYAHAENTVDELVDNGRIIDAQWMRLNITEIDWEIIQEQYDFDVVKIEKLYYSLRGPLPQELKDVVMKYYHGKTTLKAIAEKEYEYLKSKNKLNGIFGMMVTDIISDEITYSGHEWVKNPIEEEKAREKLAKHYKHKAFISYQWGIWITAHARRRLNTPSRELGNDLIYQDTDSKKFKDRRHLEYFANENERIKCEAEAAGAYVDYNGKRYYLGIWDDDGHYDRFRTWGAKKYAYEQGGALHTTVSGMSKKLGAKAVGTLENFDLEKTYYNCGRTVSVYTEDIRHQITVSGCTFTTASNIAVIDTSYTLGVSDTYYDIIKENIETY